MKRSKRKLLTLSIHSCLVLGRVAIVRGVAGYRPSHQTFPWTICRCVRASVGLSSALWKNGGSDPDAV